MIAAGLVVTFLGFLISLFSLSLTTAVMGRLALVLAGIAVSLAGMLGLLNRAYINKAIWRK